MTPPGGSYRIRSTGQCQFSNFCFKNVATLRGGLPLRGFCLGGNLRGNIFKGVISWDRTDSRRCYMDYRPWLDTGLQVWLAGWGLALIPEMWRHVIIMCSGDITELACMIACVCNIKSGSLRSSLPPNPWRNFFTPAIRLIGRHTACF